MRLGWVAYIVPFLFAFSPPLILQGDVPTVLAAVATALGGILAVSFAFAGHGAQPLGPALRLLYALAGALLIVPFELGPLWAAANIAGAALLAVLLLRERGVRSSFTPTTTTRLS